MHASGIRADEACKAAFAAAGQDPSVLFLQFRIEKETFVKVAEGKAAGSLDGNWAEIQRGLTATQQDPSFIVARGVASEPNKWLLIFYMPEGCTVRDRMVYAASSAALKDGLGQSNFEAATFSVSHPREASAAEYTAVSRSMTHDEILTLDEKAKLEGETQSAMAMGSTRTRAIVGLPIKASEESMAALASLARSAGVGAAGAGAAASAADGGINTVILLLHPETEVLHVQSTGNWTLEQIQGMLPANEPRYVVQNFVHQHEGKEASVFVFAYYCPEDIRAKLKMFYSTCKAVVVKLLEGEGIAPLARSVEFSDPRELNTPTVLEELYPSVQSKKTFKKPARPGRGNARLLDAQGKTITSPTSSNGSAAPASSPSASPSP